ncbi:MAG: cytochrome c oxidase assembly protein [Acidimicrobiia bacterium]
MILAAETDIWRYQAHPEVWVLLAGAVLLAWYSIRVIGPNAVTDGSPLVTRRNAVAYVAAVVALWAASDWPMHDISEEYLYSVHMVQHMIISFIVPPLLLVATPEWLARLIMSPDGKAGVWIRRFSHPVTAGVVFNIVIAVTHLTTVVNTSVENGVYHYTVHLVVFLASLMMWIPVIGPIKELRISLPGQMVYLFLMSIIPTVPAGFLTFAEGALYEAYDHDVRLWGIDISTDQQMAGLIMKLAGGLYLWTWIVVRFFQWNAETRGSQELVLVATEGDDGSDDELTFEAVQAEFDRTGPAPSDQS